MTTQKRPLSFKTPAYGFESLTSWLVRASLRHGMNPLDFTYYYWGAKKRLWTTDVDCTPSHDEVVADVELLSDHTPPYTFDALFHHLPTTSLNLFQKKSY